MIKTVLREKLRTYIYASRAEMGAAAAGACAEKIRTLQAQQEVINIIFAAAPSQNEMLAALIQEKDIDWTRIQAFHMDEYLGLQDDDSRRFSNFLREAIFSKLPFRNVFYIRSSGEKEALLAYYTKILTDHPVDIVCLGIGENGHIAFNDPHVADFHDPHWIKLVDLDEACRIQQVNDGCFARLDDVPKYAFTLTIPALMRAKHLICTVPAATKANAVYHTLYGEISESCPASIMRTHESAKMFVDTDSAKLILSHK